MTIIDDADVRSIAQTFDCTFDDTHARFLKATTASDLHACPGSGKTTLLVAKLALLARRWPWGDRGVLVLSHTNVARREVEQRLAKEPVAAKLLGYPHFIGTIQGFVDRSIALPYLRDVGIAGKPVEAARVDDEAFAEHITRVFFGPMGWSRYPQARSWLKNRYKHDEGAGVVRSLFYHGADLALSATPAGGVPNPTTATADQLRALKGQLAAEGFFRYADMFAFAAASLKARQFLGDALRRRFPWVFVDEMQDTSREQEDLLDGLFGVASVVFTKVGDRNQAIFAESAPDAEKTVLRWSQGIHLPQSQRLAPKLARLVSPLAVVRPIQLKGNPNRTDRAHTVFLFNDHTIARVLPAFCDLILAEWKGSLPNKFVAKAVGFRRRPPERRVVPASLVDYWADFDARPAEEPPLTTLLSSVRHARRLVELEGEFYAAYRVVYGALARLAEICEGARVTHRTLTERCKQGALDEASLKSCVAQLLRGDGVSDASAWVKTVTHVCELFVSRHPPENVRTYLSWSEPAAGPTTRTGSHTFVHRNGSSEVSIEVSTIHAVKGETHDATLVLETFFHEHDVELALPFLAGRAPLKTTGRMVEHLKRLFVGATRPKELLCFALHEDHIDADHEAALVSLGWQIQRLG